HGRRGDLRTPLAGQARGRGRPHRSVRARHRPGAATHRGRLGIRAGHDRAGAPRERHLRAADRPALGAARRAAARARGGGDPARCSNAAEWDPGVISAGQLDPGPVRPGTRFRLIVPFLRRRLALTYEVVALVPGREVVLAATGRLLRATDRIMVAADGDGATVS